MKKGRTYRTMTQDNILILSNELSIASFYELLVEEEGRQITICTHATKAISLCRKQVYDLIIIDFDMPAIFGYHFIQRLREFNYSSPLVVVSDYSEYYTNTFIDANPIRHIFTKPLDNRRHFTSIVDLILSTKAAPLRGYCQVEDVLQV
ncbi:hypothetical protein DID77_03505 [Candidatus Marinamargulisbacteria bacterium SCGC AG-439-L15]|nr:hypothetical protein DID77_03505 [Candidatus Marinamargulisbacteria bacterium SCGC AG-439-L15]